MAIQGVIRPPADIRVAADKTARFVANNGRAFERKIMNSERGKTPKFAFLHDSSPFHAYYEDRILFFQNGGEDGKKKEEEKEESKSVSGEEESNAKKSSQEETGGGDDKKENQTNDKSDDTKEDTGDDKMGSKAIAQDNVNTTSARKVTSVSDPIAKALLSERAKIANYTNNDTTNTSSEENTNEPPEPSFSLFYTTPIAPKSITPVQLELIKVTAQFVAMSGKDGTFLRDITLREWNNPTTFGFLQPRHGHFAYFSHLVDLYRHMLAKFVHIHEENEKSKHLQPEKGNGTDMDVKKNSNLSMNAVKKMVGLDESQPVAAEGGTPTNANGDEIEDLSRRISTEMKLVEHTAESVSNCLQVAAESVEYSRYKKEKQRKELEELQGTSQDGLNASAKVDWYDFVVVETIEFPVDEVVEMLPPPPPPLPPVPTKSVPVAPAVNDEMDESSDESDDDNEDVQVVSDYKPNVVSSKTTLASTDRTHVIDPITKKAIPINDMTEHMRIQLLDPKWGAEKKKFLEKQKESNYVQGEMIARNVDAFAKARGDLFGSSADQLDNREDSQKRLEEANRIIREQEQMPQPRPIEDPAVTIAPPPTTITNQTGQYMAPNTGLSQQHQKPDLLLPDPKRTKADVMLPSQSFGLHNPPTLNPGEATTDSAVATLPPPPPPLNTLPPPPPPMPVNATTTADNGDDDAQADNEDTSIIPTILSEEEFAKSLSDPNIEISITVPNMPSSTWNFNGQSISITVDVMTKIKAIKQQLLTKLGGMPVNKMQLKSPSVGFLKDGLSLAHLNIGPNYEPLELVPKVRGGRK